MAQDGSVNKLTSGFGKTSFLYLGFAGSLLVASCSSSSPPTDGGTAGAAGSPAACGNTTTDPANCGKCGNVCPSGQTCSQGLCSGGTPGGAGASGAPGFGGSPSGAGASGGPAATGGTPSLPTGGAGGVPSVAGAGGVGTTGGSPVVGAGAGGGGAGGPSTGGPPGYWTYGSWKGCVWTGIDSLAGSTTTSTPKDFLTHTPGMPYCVKGSVHGDYESVALLGFNLAEPETASCAYKPVDPTAMGPSAVPIMTAGATGIAINFAKNTASTLRVQIQGPNGASDENNRWCWTITGATSPVFAPFSEFNTKCWDDTGNKYNGEPISAVVFAVPGATTATPFDYCINGFAVGDSADDAPKGGAVGGPLMGTIGGPGSTDLDFQRVKVVAGGKSYIIQNNNWGRPDGSNQTITYKDNSFVITQSDGTKGPGGEPASFPSIFIGGNGNTAEGLFSTRSDDGLPKQISSIQSVMSRFRYKTNGGDLNASYDIWFSASPPSAEYEDALSGFIMLWLYKPAGNSPIGSVQRTFTHGGRTWDVWVGPRGGSRDNRNAPVVSYVAQQSQATGSFEGDLKPFFMDAAQHGIQPSWYLTDVFGGFEIWTGSAGNGAAVEEFTAVVQ